MLAKESFLQNTTPILRTVTQVENALSVLHNLRSAVSERASIDEL